VSSNSKNIDYYSCGELGSLVETMDNIHKI